MKNFNFKIYYRRFNNYSKSNQLILRNSVCFCEINPNKIYNPESIYKNTKKINILEKFPTSFQNYLKLGRYDKPIGYLLLFWPCAWGLTIGATSINLEYVKYLALFFTGSVLMRSSGCIINDMWDADYDKKVERSKDRPIACGKISYKKAFVFLSCHLAISLCILLQLPISSIIAGFSVMPIVILYPYMKRLTYFPQFFLGLAFNSGAIIGYITMNPMISITSSGVVFISLYLGGIIWTIIYDTIYAHMDKIDDIKVNIKSTALYFGDKTKCILSILIVMMTFLFYYSLKEKYRVSKIKPIKLSEMFLIMGMAYQFYIIYKVDINSPISCLRFFIANNYYGMIIFLACLALHVQK